MTKGQILRKQLGLENFKNAKIARAIIPSPTNIYFIFIYSKNPNSPIPFKLIRDFPRTSTIWNGKDILKTKLKLPTFAPLMDLDLYNGSISNNLFNVVDISWERWLVRDKKEYTKLPENIKKSYYEGKLQEFVSLEDLKDKDNITYSLQFRKERNKIMGQEHTTAKLIDIVFNQKEGSITFQFLTTSTNKYPDDYIYKETDPVTFNLKNNPAKVYEIYVKFLDFYEWLDAWEGEIFTEKDLKEILKDLNVQVWSNSPSFHWQGINYNLSQLDAAIYPTNIPLTDAVYDSNGKMLKMGWKQKQKDGFLDKHLYGLIRAFYVKSVIGSILKMLNEKLKNRGLLT